MTNPTPLLTPVAELAGRYDLVVIGSGCAGMTAALVARHAGASVLVLEKAEQLGGTTAAGGGVMWAPDNHLMDARGFTDTPETAADYVRAATGGRLSEEEIAWYVSTAAEAVRFLDEHTRVDYAPLSRPDYHMDWPGATPGGRGLDHREFDPSLVPGLAEVLRQPTYLPLITMDERDQLHGAAPDPDLLSGRAERGVRTMGGALAGALTASAWEAGVVIAAPAPATGLERSGEQSGEPSGEQSGRRWRVTVAGEKDVTADAVVLASGGFEWSPELTGTLLTFPITPISAPSNTGDGLKLGMAAGASFTETTDIWGVPVITAHGARYGGHPSGRMGNVEATLPGGIVVNAAGRRFVNEALNYHDFSRVFANIDPETSDFANIPAFLVMDSRFTARYPVAGHPVFSDPADAPDWLVQSPTLAGLAELIGVDPEGLEQTVAAFNPAAGRGEDPQFGRGASEQDRHLGDPQNRPNPCLAPVAQAPFYAVQLHPGALGTAGGLRADLHGRVLDWDGEALPGLYAAGNCSATVFKDAYPGGGATIGSAITRAYAAGRHLAQALDQVTQWAQAGRS
ncbi:FAD-dependent oxidoreductase [Citricoccus sp. NPDC055426]|uniref:FAD-dependent oxidoreductase n=1 Tax=Citricoccus sp. NPDC055426 TaxID=3155536 RepID=UPI003413C0CA